MSSLVLGDSRVRTHWVPELLSGIKHTLLVLALILDLSQAVSPVCMTKFAICDQGEQSI